MLKKSPWPSSEIHKAWFAWSLVAILWGSTYPVLRIAVRSYPPEFFASLRFLSAGVLFLLWAWISKADFNLGKKEWFRQISIGSLNLIFCHGLIIYSAQWVYSGLLAVLLALSPTFSALLELALGRSRLAPMAWGGLVLGLLGVGMLSLSAENQNLNLSPWIVAVIVAAAFLAIGSLVSQTPGKQTNLWLASGIQMSFAGIGLAGISGLLGEWPRVHLHPETLWTWAYLTLFGSMVAYSAFVYSLRILGPVITGTYTYANIAVATLLAWLMLGERLSAVDLGGMCLICIGVWLVQAGKSKT